MDRQTIQSLKLTFDDIMHITDDGVEYWSARELCKVLGYNEFNKFIPVIKRPYLHVRIVDFQHLIISLR